MVLTTIYSVINWVKNKGNKLWFNVQQECARCGDRTWLPGRAVEPNKLEEEVESEQKFLAGDSCPCGGPVNVSAYAIGVAGHPAYGRITMARQEGAIEYGSIKTPDEDRNVVLEGWTLRGLEISVEKMYCDSYHNLKVVVNDAAAGCVARANFRIKTLPEGGSLWSYIPDGEEVWYEEVYEFCGVENPVETIKGWFLKSNEGNGELKWK